ncbi:alpha/beta fold hydrolase [Phenylobacterium sp. VNQ135]|uniref:alpha/beta fold hydrolase n=1 Tax=Phenylobacterium sp. VNQ135 TaxID=3400922 RepID=UPI003C040B4E
MISADRDPIVSALLRIAGDPAQWECLADVLPGCEAPRTASDGAGHIASVAALAALSRARGEGEPTAPAVGELGVVLTAPNGRVLACNGAAAASLRALGRAEPGQPLAFDDETNGRAASAALETARRTGRRVGVRFDTAQGPLFASAAPARALIGDAAPHVGALLVFSADAGGEATSDLLRQSFRLTDAELRLARDLANGLSLQRAAQSAGVSVHTARNQLRAVFDKVGVQRQSDLVRAMHQFDRMAGGTPAFEAPAVEAPPLQRMRLPDGRWLGFREYGDPAGRAFLAFHEGLGSSLMPPGTDDLARALGLRLLAPERPGFGQSDPLPHAYRFEAVAEDMVCFLAERGVQRLRIGAILSGAASALHTAARLGERVDLVLLCSGRAPQPTSTDRASSLFARLRAGFERQPWAMEAIFAILQFRRSPELIRQMITRVASAAPGDAAWLRTNPQFADYVCQYVGECLARGSRGPVQELVAFRRGRDRPPPLAPSTQVAVWHGAQGDAAPLASLLDALGAAPAELRVFDDAGMLMTPRRWPEILARAARPDDASV